MELKNQNNVLEIRTSPSRRVNTLITCVIGLFAIYMLLSRKIGLDPDGTFPAVIILILIGAALVIVLIKNLFATETIRIVKVGVDPDGSTIPSVVCSDIVSIERTDRPAYLSWDWSMSYWGFGKGAVTLVTNAGTVYFGESLNEDETEELISRIAQFCVMNRATAES